MTLGFLTQSCKKDLPTMGTEKGQLQLSLNQTDFQTGLKDVGFDSVPECSDLGWSYAKFVINGDTIKTGLITMADGTVNTEPLQLDVGVYTVTRFWVFNDNGTPNDESDDILIRAAPLPGSTYYPLVANALDISVEIQAFKKVNYVIDVLCYEELFYEEFGFVWFTLNDVVVHQICVFGDVCTTDPDLYAGSLYEGQQNGLQMDMPAIFEALIYKNEVLQSTFSNEAWLGEGECLPVYWADDVDLDEDFYLVIKTLLPVGTGFGYVTTDSIAIDPDDGSGLMLDDGVLVFEVGDCNGGPNVYGCTAWINLPTTTFTFTLSGNSYMVIDAGTGDTTWYPASLGTYFSYDFSGVPSGYAVHDGTWAGWCGDKNTGISGGNSYTAKFVSSVQPLPTGFYLSQTQVNELNWIFNHLQDFFPGLDQDDWVSWQTSHPGEFYELQTAIWMITNGISSGSHTLAQSIYDVAIANPLYSPPMDGTGIVFVYMGNDIQLQFIQLHC